MSWKLHDPTHRATVTDFPTREDAERWRDAHGLEGVFAVAPQEPTATRRTIDRHTLRRRRTAASPHALMAPRRTP